MNTEAIKNRPSSFEEYVGQNGAANYLKAVIEKNKHPSGIVISGLPGCGKSTLAELYIKTTLCSTREEGSTTSCGTCESCKQFSIEQMISNSDLSANPNVLTYRVTEASAFKESVKDIIDFSKFAPVPTHDNIREDNLRKFIVIDEAQSASRQSLSAFLDSLEFANSKITTILISMDMDKMDNTVREAIESRCVELKLSSLSDSEISDKLTNVYPSLDSKAASLLAFLSNGNLRKAWSLFDFFSTQFSIPEITEEVISSQRLGGLSKDFFLSILFNLSNNKWEEVYKHLFKLHHTDNTIGSVFIKYLLEMPLSIDGVELVSNLSFWTQCSYKVPLMAVFLPFRGKKIIIENQEEEEISDLLKNSKEKLRETTPLVPIKVKETSVSNLKGSIISMNSKPTKEEFLLCSMTTFKEVIKHYADN